MTIQECLESWNNGNRSTVIDFVVGLPSNAETAFYATVISKELYGRDDWHTFLTMLSNRVLDPIRILHHA